MERRSAIFSVVCLLCALPVARAQDLRISIPAWIETEKAIAPKFEATLNGTPASVSAQLGPSSDQVILIVLDVTGDPSYVDPARQALVAEISKLPHNTWVALLRAQDGLRVRDERAQLQVLVSGIDGLETPQAGAEQRGVPPPAPRVAVDG